MRHADELSTTIAPAAATVEFYTQRGGLPADGPLSVIVPGAVGGAELALRTYGTRPMSEVLPDAFGPADLEGTRG